MRKTTKKLHHLLLHFSSFEMHKIYCMPLSPPKKPLEGNEQSLPISVLAQQQHSSFERKTKSTILNYDRHP